MSGVITSYRDVQPECALCSGRTLLSESKRLYCAHTYCLKCLKGLVMLDDIPPKNPVVGCPLCLTLTPIHSPEIACQSTVFDLQSLLDALPPLVQPESPAEVAKTEDSESYMCEIHEEIEPDTPAEVAETDDGEPYEIHEEWDPETLAEVAKTEESESYMCEIYEKIEPDTPAEVAETDDGEPYEIHEEWEPETLAEVAKTEESESYMCEIYEKIEPDTRAKVAETEDGEPYMCEIYEEWEPETLAEVTETEDGERMCETCGEVEPEATAEVTETEDGEPYEIHEEWEPETPAEVTETEDLEPYEIYEEWEPETLAEVTETEDGERMCETYGEVEPEATAEVTETEDGEPYEIHEEWEPETPAEVTETEDGEPPVCEIHNEVKKFYCCSCEVLICRDCTVVDHPRPQHKCMNLDEACTWRCALNERELQTAVRVVKQVNRSGGILKSTEVALNQRCDQVITEIERCREMGLEQLQWHVEAIEAFQMDLEAEIFGLHDLTEDATKKDLLEQSTELVESLMSLCEQQEEVINKPQPVQYPAFLESVDEIQGWPKPLNLDGLDEEEPDLPTPEGQQSLESKDQSNKDTDSTSRVRIPPVADAGPVVVDSSSRKDSLGGRSEKNHQPRVRTLQSSRSNDPPKIERGNTSRLVSPLKIPWPLFGVGTANRQPRQRLQQNTRSGTTSRRLQAYQTMAPPRGFDCQRQDSPGGRGKESRGRGQYHHSARGGANNYGRGGADNRGRGGADHRGHFGADHRGRGGSNNRSKSGADNRGRGGADNRGGGGASHRGHGGADHHGRGGTDNRGGGGASHRGRGEADHRGRGGADNRGRGGAHHRGRGGHQQHGRGGKQGQGGGKQGQGSGRQKGK
ncbi:uncharacterized protein LOC110976491 [Acanthaster planci]|uniref:Uncharacterized protein LOC110976491 n=1 Tax=Acanthaster planci TaxID=133434 RepID=A0A8B7XX89_ACAPL|nr:uncharacterized protein LOC110976491 [Acanthaster planci]